MSTANTDLFVTIVSSDRELLCDLSWTLSLFGYNVTATCDFSDESPCRRNSKPSILLIDTRSNSETAEVLALSPSSGFVYRIAIETADSTEKVLLEGADDVVRHPVNTGELLTRLRAGVRRLEFEHRLSQRSRRDRATGLLTRQALCRSLGASNPAITPTTCVTFGIDFLTQIREQYGIHAIRHLKATLARCIEQSLEGKELAAIIGENALLATLHRGSDGAHQFAGSVATAFAASDTLIREIRSLPTLSAVIAEWDVGIATDEQLGRCESTLEQVHYFGGNHIASAAEVQHRISNWRTDLDAGVPFEDVVAQDLMEQFPAIITRKQADAGYEAALPSPDMQIPCIPIVDDDGKLAGALKFANTQIAPSGSQTHTIEYNQPLSDLFEAFNTTESDYLVVVDDQNCPIGYLTCEGLASLVLDQMNADRYQSADADFCSAASLIVPVVAARPNDPQPSVAT